MKIILSAYSCEPNKGSEPGYGWNWGYYLALRGHEVHLITRIQGREAIERELSEKNIQNLKIYYIDIPQWSKRFIKGQAGVYLHYLLWQKQAYLFVKRIVDQVDILHHVTWGSLHGGSHMWKFNKPFIFGPIGGGQVAPNAFYKLFENEWHKEKLRTISTNHIQLFFAEAAKTIRNADLVLAGNQETLDRIQNLKAKESQLFSDTGLPTDFIPTTMPIRKAGDVLRILWVGRVYPRKGLRLIFMALQHLHIPFMLSIVGDGPWGHKIHDWINDYGLTGKVEWFGKLPWNELKQFYLNHDIFVFTSLRESFGVQLLEAMAFGLPVVTLNHFGARDFIPEKAAFKVEVNTPETTAVILANAIEQLGSQPALRTKMGLAGYEYSKTQTWDKKILEIEKKYQKLLMAK